MGKNFNDPEVIRQGIEQSKQAFICLDCLDTSDRLLKLEDIIRMPKRTWLCPECKGCAHNVNQHCIKSPSGDKLFGRDPEYIPITHLCYVGKRTPNDEKICMSELCCPLCKNPIHKTVGKTVIISIVGTRDSGKSHYIGVLLHELMENFSNIMHWKVEVEDDTRKMYDNNFSSLYNAQQTLALTMQNMTGFYAPYIFYVTPHGKSTFTLVFFDTAGEDFNSDNLIENSAKHIFQADGVIFIIDPLKMNDLNNQIEEDVIAGSSSSTYERLQNNSLLTMVSTTIRRHLQIPDSEQISIPMAITLSKFDTIEKLFPSYNTIVIDSNHRRIGAFSEQDCESVNKEVFKFLNRQDSTEIKSFLMQLQINYSDYHLFGASALGLRNHPINGRIKRPKPHRVEDPLLWILKNKNVI